MEQINIGEGKHLLKDLQELKGKTLAAGASRNLVTVMYLRNWLNCIVNNH